ncbi:MAG: hypothetical protein ACLGI6_22455, partial [Gammaproteobacteria bacterium]
MSSPRPSIRPLALCLALLLAACDSSDPHLLVASAQQQRDRGELRAAVIQLKNALQQDGELADARQLLGEVYLDQDDPLSVEQELRRALALTSGPAADQLDRKSTR